MTVGIFFQNDLMFEIIIEILEGAYYIMILSSYLNVPLHISCKSTITSNERNKLKGIEKRNPHTTHLPYN